RGRYPAERLAHVSPERITRFFTRTGTSYQVSKEIRDLVLFARHNVINDPPFSNVDLVSCRNLLIYLGDELQQRVLPLFHYALRPNGFLFLGPAESFTMHQDLFHPIDVKHRISRRVASNKRTTPPMNVKRGQRPPATVANAAHGETEILQIMQRQLHNDFTPKGLVVNDEGQVVAVSENLEAYLAVAAGPFVNSVTHLVRNGLRIAVRSALRESVALNKRVVHHGGTLETAGEWQRVSVTVQPMEATPNTAGLYLIVFQPAGHPVSATVSNGVAAATVSSVADDSQSLAVIERLEFELASTREELYRTVQDLEALNEELKSSNEELLSMNEELQSSNEELETSKQELQEANDSLEITNGDLTNLLTSTQIPTVFLDNEGKVRRVTPTASAIYNLYPADVGRPLHHFTHKAVLMPPLPDADAVYRAERAIETDVRMIDGTVYVRRVLPYLTPEGTLDGVVVTFIDVTEARLQIEATVESEQRFRQLAETIPQLAWMARADGHIFWYNQRWYEYTGKTPEDMEGWGWTDVHDPDLLPAVTQRWRNALTTGTPFEMVFPLRGRDTNYHPFLTRVNPFRDESGAITLWFGTNTDLSEERANVDALRRHQRELQMLADNSPDVLTRFDRKLRHVFVNAAVEQATGLPASAFLGKTHREMGIPEMQAIEWETRIKRVFQSGEREHVDFAYETPAGLRYYSGIMVPERDEQGSVESVLSFTRDSTRERIAENELRDANRQKDQFLATLAHELRNPLAPVRNGLEILRLLPNVNSEVISIRDMMERQIVNMTRLIDDLLDISRISLGKVDLKLQRTSLQSIVEGATEVARPAIEASRHELTVEMPDEAIAIVADSTRIMQVLGNLLSNSAKYTPAGGQISVHVSADAHDAIIRIIDNGVGIPPAMMARVFEKFVQVDAAIDRPNDGLGIGLSLARQLVELHRGTIHGASDGVNLGCTFTVRLPLAPAEETTVLVQAVDDAGDEPVSECLRILVVDDNVEAARSLQKVLELMGHQSSSAYTAATALEAIEVTMPDVIFLDIGLPDVSGYELAGTIRGKAATTPVVLVALTGWGSEEHRRRSSEAGFDFHLAKPAEVAMIRRILSPIVRTSAP
ncbi:MAG: PAS domain-containing protein, partial [Gemmatimonadota bacterium]|nr:PAS domain-containing protein [Gemmatimonadota bacterium]